MHPFKRLPWYPLLFPTLRSHPRIFYVTKVLQSLFHKDWILFPVAIGSLMDWRGPGVGQGSDGLSDGSPTFPQKKACFGKCVVTKSLKSWRHLCLKRKWMSSESEPTINPSGGFLSC